MKCEQVKDLILTDYLDGVLDETTKVRLENHLESCSHCHEFAQVALKTVLYRFDNVERKQAPEHVWTRIENALTQEQVFEPNNFAAWLEKMKLNFWNPKPVMVFMAVFILILSFGAINQIKIQQAVSNEQSIEYLASLINPNTEVYSTERGNFGTTVEQYFL